MGELFASLFHLLVGLGLGRLVTGLYYVLNGPLYFTFLAAGLGGLAVTHNLNRFYRHPLFSLTLLAFISMSVHLLSAHDSGGYGGLVWVITLPVWIVVLPLAYFTSLSKGLNISKARSRAVTLLLGLVSGFLLTYVSPEHTQRIQDAEKIKLHADAPIIAEALKAALENDLTAYTYSSPHPRDDNFDPVFFLEACRKNPKCAEQGYRYDTSQKRLLSSDGSEIKLGFDMSVSPRHTPTHAEESHIFRPTRLRVWRCPGPNTFCPATTVPLSEEENTPPVEYSPPMAGEKRPEEQQRFQEENGKPLPPILQNYLGTPRRGRR